MVEGWVTFFSAVTGGLIAGGSSILTAKMIIEKQKFDVAETKFRSALIAESVKYTHKIPDIDFIMGNLDRSSRRIQAANFEFIFQLKRKKRDIFQREVFRCHKKYCAQHTVQDAHSVLSSNIMDILICADKIKPEPTLQKGLTLIHKFIGLIQKYRR